MKKFNVSFPYFLEYPIKVVVNRLGLLGLFGWVFQKFGKRWIRPNNIVVSERIVELPNVYAFLGKYSRVGDSILEIGHVNSSLALELANLGYQVTAIDIRDYPFSHRNLRNLKSDFLTYDFGTARFSWIISVSAIEHLGYNRRYGGDREGDQDLDQSAFEKISKLLMPGGWFILTVPYAAQGGKHWFKVYTRDTIEALLDRCFGIEAKKYYFRNDNQWFETANPDQDPQSPTNGVAIFLLKKR